MPDGPRREEAAALLALIDRFETLLERSELAELEVEAGETMLRLVKHSALLVTAPAVTVAAPSAGQTVAGPAPIRGEAAPVAAPSGLHAVVAPLTGIFYRSPSPDAAPYVREGGPVNVGQVIGLIEAMKLFNEIKSDMSGVVRRIVPENGALVKQKQTLIEVEPS